MCWSSSWSAHIKTYNCIRQPGTNISSSILMVMMLGGSWLSSPPTQFLKNIGARSVSDVAQSCCSLRHWNVKNKMCFAEHQWVGFTFVFWETFFKLIAARIRLTRPFFNGGGLYWRLFSLSKHAVLTLCSVVDENVVQPANSCQTKPYIPN